MRRNFRIALTLLFVSLSVVSYSQKRYDKVMKMYEAGEYMKVIDPLKDLYSSGVVTDGDKKITIVFTIADCYRRTAQTRKSEMWLSKAIDKGYPDPVVYLYYAEALKMNEKFEEAVDQYKKYRELVPDDRRGDDGIKSCELSLVWKQNPSGYEVNEVPFFNTKMEDYAPCFGKEDYDRLYFTSNRDGSTGDYEHGATGESFSDIYESRKDKKGSWSEPVPLSETVNSDFEDGAPCISFDFKTLYFTRCKMDVKKKSGCQLYFSTRNGEEWGKAQEIKIKDDSIMIAHPAITPDELTLFFVSDMKGSIEENNQEPSKDIWMINRESVTDDWGEPINLGSAINTPSSEMFPYVHADGTLYFASNGKLGMGGLDIFKAKQDENGEWQVENMRWPVNSSMDDFGICFEHDVERGFFSSNRSGRGTDIYSFYLPPLKFNITGIVKNSKTDEAIPNATIKSISSDGITLESKTDSEGRFKYILKPQTDYVYVFMKKDYLNGKHRESTKNKAQSENFTPVIYLTPIAGTIKVDNIFYEYAKADLLPESIVSLDKLVEILNDNPNITIQLMAHTDADGDDKYNDDLSQRRAQSVVNYLIEKGISKDRLEAKGYGKRSPVVVDKMLAKKYPFFFEGDVLTVDFINKLATEEQKEIAKALNRRTEFKVLRQDYVGR